MASLLLIDNNVRQDLQSLAEYARNNEYSFDDLLDRKNGDMQPPGDDPNFFRLIPVGYRVVFTVENQPTCKVRHMSISTAAKGKIPHPAVINEILELLGFDNTVEIPIGFQNPDFHVSIYEQNSISVVERIKKEL